MLESSPFIRRRLRRAAVAVLLCHAGVASALGFGAIRVHSALNEPLDATINLVAVTPEERAALDVQMASVDMFQRFGIERTALADRIRVSVAEGAGPGQVQVRLTTRGVVREPFLRFLIEADTGAGRALREYTVLLDPPGRAPAAPATAAQPSAAPSQAAPAQTAEVTAPRATPARASAEPAGPASNEYGPVRAGETLSRIARQVRRPGATPEQMQVAIYRNNPQAFSDNMNVLLRGAMLAIPPVERIRAIAPDVARAVVAEQREQAVASIAAENQATATSTLARAEAPPTTTQARLRLEAPRAIGTRGDGGGAVGTAGFGRLLMPEFPASDDSVAAADAVDNAEQPAATDATPAEPAVGSGADTATEGATSSAAVEADPMVSGGNSVAEGGDAVDASENVGSDPNQATEGAAPDATLSADAPSAEAEPVAPASDTAEAYQPLPSENQDVAYSGGSNSLLHPRNLLLLAAGLLLLVALLIWNRRRQYTPVTLDFNDVDTESAPGAAVENEQGEAPYYEAPAAEPVPADEALAPSLRVQEADRQMKVGLFDEARAGLEEGLAHYPDDRGLQDKRLELDYVAGDSAAFSANVERFGSQLSTDGVRWAGVATMGRVLLPQDPRFGFTDRPEDRETAPVEAPTPQRESAQSIIERFEAGVEDDKADPLDAIAESDDSDRYFSLDDDTPADTAGDATDTLDGRDIPAHTLDDEASAGRDSSAYDLGSDGGFEWQDQEIDTSGTREHDLGDDPGMAFDLDTSSSDTPAEPDKPAYIKPIDTSEFDLGDDEAPASDDAADPVEVRLDLARMYIDMEDHAAARELLQEAVNDGTEAQRATAQELLNSL